MLSAGGRWSRVPLPASTWGLPQTILAEGVRHNQLWFCLQKEPRINSVRAIEDSVKSYVARLSRALKLDKMSTLFPSDSKAQLVEWQTVVPEVQVPLESTALLLMVTSVRKSRNSLFMFFWGLFWNSELCIWAFGAFWSFYVFKELASNASALNLTHGVWHFYRVTLSRERWNVLGDVVCRTATLSLRFPLF